MNLNDINERLNRFVSSFMRPEVFGPIIAAGVILVILTFIPVIGQLLGIIVLAFLVYWIWTRWLRNA